jgi:hypothetical protein
MKAQRTKNPPKAAHSSNPRGPAGIYSTKAQNALNQLYRIGANKRCFPARNIYFYLYYGREKQHF